MQEELEKLGIQLHPSIEVEYASARKELWSGKRKLHLILVIPNLKKSSARREIERKDPLFEPSARLYRAGASVRETAAILGLPDADVRLLWARIKEKTPRNPNWTANL